jgi:hypothetical protein
MPLEIKIILSLIAIFFAAAAPAAWSEEGKTFETRYYCNGLDGARRWEAVTRITAQARGGKGHYRLIEEGRGRYSPFNVPVSWTAEVEFISNADTITPIALEKTVLSGDGKVLYHEDQRFDSDKKTVTCEITGAGAPRTKTFAYKGEVTNYLLLGLFTQKFLERGIKERTFYLVSGEPSLYQVTAKVLGEEEIAINGVSVRSYKIYLDPDMGILSPLEVIAPKAYVWHSSRPKFEWLRYRGVESAPLSPRVEMITMEIKK